MRARHKALVLAGQLVAKKGIDVQVFDLHELSSFTDFFVIATGTSTRHVRTLADVTVQGARQEGERTLGVEGDPPGRWILVDLGDVIVHLFEEDARDFYGLERLWGEAETLALPAGAGAVAEAS